MSGSACIIRPFPSHEVQLFFPTELDLPFPPPPFPSPPPQACTMTMVRPPPHIPSSRVISPHPHLNLSLPAPPSGLHYDDGPASPARRILPVFVFDVSDGGEFGLLIDGTVKATAFADMVVAVSSRAEKTSSHFTCRCGEQSMWAVEGSVWY